jgi:hypothetical protein
MNSKEIYDELSSGRWLITLIKRTGYAFNEETHADLLATRAAVHFQEMFNAYHNALTQEESETEANRVRVVEDLEANPDKIAEYRAAGWSVTRRVKKSLDLDSFIEDYDQEIPKEALAVIKTKLPKRLQKELIKYESVQGYSFTVKRSEKED